MKVVRLLIKQKKRIFDRIKVITSENTNFILALLLMALLAISVNVVELALVRGYL